jgi:hypothetical protein
MQEKDGRLLKLQESTLEPSCTIEDEDSPPFRHDQERKQCATRLTVTVSVITPDLTTVIGLDSTPLERTRLSPVGKSARMVDPALVAPAVIVISWTSFGMKTE